MPAKREYESAAQKQAAYRKRCRMEMEAAGKGMPPLPGYRRWKAMRKQAASLLETALNEMEAYYEQRSEAWQDSERAEEFSEMMESLEEISAMLKDLDSPVAEA